MKAIIFTMVIAIPLVLGIQSAEGALFPTPNITTQPTTPTHHIIVTTPAPQPQSMRTSLPAPFPMAEASTTAPNDTSAPSTSQQLIPGLNLNQALSFGGTFVGGGVLGFAVGYALKKVMKLALIVLGLFIAGLAILQNKGIVKVDWVVTQHTANDLAKQAAEQINQALHTANAGLHTTHLDILYPALGVVGFMPGAVVGFKMG